MDIGGNLTALVQVKDKGQKNIIGERKHEWTDIIDLCGWLDLSGGQNNYSTFNAKIQESTHMFICGYHSFKNLSSKWTVDENGLASSVVKSAAHGETVDLTSENGRMVINGSIYDILLIDDPMNMHQHLEIYLKYVGGGQGVG